MLGLASEWRFEKGDRKSYNGSTESEYKNKEQINPVPPFSDLQSFELAMQDFHPRSHPSLVLKPSFILLC